MSEGAGERESRRVRSAIAYIHEGDHHLGVEDGNNHRLRIGTGGDPLRGTSRGRHLDQGQLVAHRAEVLNPNLRLVVRKVLGVRVKGRNRQERSAERDAPDRRVRRHGIGPDRFVGTSKRVRVQVDVVNRRGLTNVRACHNDVSSRNARVKDSRVLVNGHSLRPRSGGVVVGEPETVLIPRDHPVGGDLEPNIGHRQRRGNLARRVQLSELGVGIRSRERRRIRVESSNVLGDPETRLVTRSRLRRTVIKCSHGNGHHITGQARVIRGLGSDLVVRGYVGADDVWRVPRSDRALVDRLVDRRHVDGDVFRERDDDLTTERTNERARSASERDHSFTEELGRHASTRLRSQYQHEYQYARCQRACTCRPSRFPH